MVTLFGFFISFILALPGDVKVSYLEQKPDDSSGFLVYQKTGNDYVDHVELVLKAAEVDLCDYAKTHNFAAVEIFVAEMRQAELPTESQWGCKSTVTLWVNFKKT